MDFALSTRKRLIHSATSDATEAAHVEAVTDRLAAHLAAARIKALNYLGKKWVLHPDYSVAENPQHSHRSKTSLHLARFLHKSGAMKAGRV